MITSRDIILFIEYICTCTTPAEDIVLLLFCLCARASISRAVLRGTRHYSSVIYLIRDKITSRVSLFAKRLKFLFLLALSFLFQKFYSQYAHEQSEKMRARVGVASQNEAICNTVVAGRPAGLASKIKMRLRSGERVLLRSGPNDPVNRGRDRLAGSLVLQIKRETGALTHASQESQGRVRRESPWGSCRATIDIPFIPMYRLTCRPSSSLFLRPRFDGRGSKQPELQLCREGGEGPLLTT